MPPLGQSSSTSITKAKHTATQSEYSYFTLLYKGAATIARAGIYMYISMKTQQDHTEAKLHLPQEQFTCNALNAISWIKM